MKSPGGESDKPSQQRKQNLHTSFFPPFLLISGAVFALGKKENKREGIKTEMKGRQRLWQPAYTALHFLQHLIQSAQQHSRARSDNCKREKEKEKNVTDKNVRNMDATGMKQNLKSSNLFLIAYKLQVFERVSIAEEKGICEWLHTFRHSDLHGHQIAGNDTFSRCCLDSPLQSASICFNAGCYFTTTCNYMQLLSAFHFAENLQKCPKALRLQHKSGLMKRVRRPLRKYQDSAYNKVF